jgi:hypothetical protein
MITTLLFQCDGFVVIEYSWGYHRIEIESKIGNDVVGMFRMLSILKQIEATEREREKKITGIFTGSYRDVVVTMGFR